MTEEATVVITGEELEQAHENWITFHYGIECEEVDERFFKYCHSLEQSFVDALLDWHDPAWVLVAPSTANNIKQLASPHFRAIIKAYYVKHYDSKWKLLTS